MVKCGQKMVTMRLRRGQGDNEREPTGATWARLPELLRAAKGELGSTAWSPFWLSARAPPADGCTQTRTYSLELTLNNELDPDQRLLPFAEKHADLDLDVDVDRDEAEQWRRRRLARAQYPCRGQSSGGGRL